MLFISLTVCEICLFEFIRVEGGVKFMKVFKWRASYRSLGTCGLCNKQCLLIGWLVGWSVGDHLLLLRDFGLYVIIFMNSVL
jgi:hypothetical protein